MDSYLDQLLYNAKGNRVMLTRRRQAEPIAGEPVVPAPEVPASAGPVSVTHDGGVAVVEVLQPRISQENILPIREALSEAMERRPAIVLDLQRVGYLTSIFLGLVVSTHRHLRSRGGWLVLSGLQAPVREILESVALDKLLKTASSRDEAVDLLKKHLKDAE
jgi:anti-anti-sigma factor